MRVRMERAARMLGVLSLCIFPSITAQAQDARIAIIDSSDSTQASVANLADAGVVAIGRYYGRCPQWLFDRSKRIVREKRMIDNLDEVSAILSDQRLGILSVYQFYSQSLKFDSDRSSGAVTVLDDRPRNASARTVAEFNDCITPDRPNTIEEDARLDGYAAVAQAREIIRQPAGTAIYFGVDYDLRTKGSAANVLTYFRIIRKIVTDAGYVTGVYGNGAVGDLLRGENPSKERLVEYVWLNASPAHAGSAQTYNDRHWDLLQTKTETKWTLDKRQISLDTNIQNPRSTNVGFWNKSGPFIIPSDRNVAVHSATRFVCEGRPSVFDDSGKPVARPACTTTFGAAVRISGMNTSKTLYRVDCDESGTVDGWMSVKDLSTRRPIWVPDSERAKAHCTSR